ncbi:MAG TPA: hypothetical protein VN718_08620 [Rhizomicrobium sp.]|nr:hypothetical protein [Rhizomicrobium sp.]
MRLFVSTVLATALFASNALAGSTTGPLSPGKPAGVKAAQMALDNTVLIAVGVGVVAAGIAIAATSGSSHKAAATTTTTTTTTTTSP